ncbi:nucleoside 2-deoxyribosyltransferase, partial [Mesorhizobium sp. CC13]|uniref:nucleoside 2-deoxyribosyltransferase n=1 Tax=Mesorhizobium sp. CC13 TaxID=3029194 RepID=UPI003267A64F
GPHPRPESRFTPGGNPSNPIFQTASYVVKPEVDAAVSALEYHNFVVRRPVQENGEAESGSTHQALRDFYHKDVELLKCCSLVLAVPLFRDPGTLVEVGMAIAMGKPVITFDPRKENGNTMVICGSNVYSEDLDNCLNGVFACLSNIRKTHS